MPVRVGVLRQRLVQHRDVVGRGVAAGIAPAEGRGEELPGVVAERQHRVIAKGVTVD